MPPRVVSLLRPIFSACRPCRQPCRTGLFGDPVVFERFLAPLTQDRTLTTWMVTGISLVYLSGQDPYDGMLVVFVLMVMKPEFW